MTNNNSEVTLTSEQIDNLAHGLDHTREMVLRMHSPQAIEAWLKQLQRDSFDLQHKINHTSKWRKIKRYRLLEKLYQLDEDRGLIAHVYDPDGSYF